MGLMSNTASISQLQIVEGELPPQAERYEWLKARLEQLRFVNIKDTTDEVSTGVVELHDQSRSEFADPGAIWIGNYFCFTIRKDVRRIPGAVMRETLQDAMKTWLFGNPGFTRIPKQGREELKEIVRAQLMEKTLPVPTTYDVAWNTETGVVTLATISRNGLDLLDTLFKKAFPEFRLQLIHPYARAEQIAVNIGLGSELAALNMASTPAVLDLIAANKWIGTDFLLWLLHSGMTGGMGGQQRAWIDNKIVLQGESEEGPQSVTILGPQHRLKELKAAIRDNKKISEATIYLEDGDDTWRLTLKGEAFFFASYKCPNVTLERDDTVDQVNEQQAVFLERMHLVTKGIGLLELALTSFLERRLGGDVWIETLQEIHEWLLEGEQGNN